MLKCINDFSRKMFTAIYEYKNTPTSPMPKLAKQKYSACMNIAIKSSV